MSIPSTPEFADLLLSVSLSESSDHGDPDRVPLFGPFIGASTLPPDRSVPALSYQDGGPLPFSALIRKIQHELRGRGHPLSENLVRILIGIYSLNPDRKTNPVETFNSMLDCIIDADVSQFFILPFPAPPDYHLQFGDFTLGKLDLETLRYRCETADSDYFDRYGDGLKGTFAFARNPRSIKMVNLVPIRDIVAQRSPSQLNLFRHTWDDYFMVLSSELFNQFWQDFSKQQEIVTAAGGPYLNETLPQQAPHSIEISVFKCKINGRSGFVNGGQRVIGFELAKSDRKFEKVRSFLRQEFSFENCDDSPVGRTLSSFSRFVSRAKRFELAGQIEEAFLHHVIALDLLFGESSRITDSVSRRAAIVCHRSLGSTYSEMKKRIGRLYEVRSSYVHAGKLPQQTSLDEVKKITDRGMLSLFRIHQGDKISCPRDEFPGRWQKQLDAAAAAVEAGDELSDDRLAELGLAFDGKTSKIAGSDSALDTA